MNWLGETVDTTGRDMAAFGVGTDDLRIDVQQKGNPRAIG